MTRKLIDMAGRKYARLEVLEYVGTLSRHAMWKCRCDCGEIVQVSGSNIRAGNTMSCRCYHAEVMKSTKRRKHLSKKSKRQHRTKNGRWR